MRIRTAALMVAAISAASFLGTGSASAQTTTTVVYPDDNVAAAASRRPGLWVSAGLGTVVERQSKILYQHDGASPQPQEKQDLRTDLLIAALESFFDTLNSLFSAANLLSALTSSTTSG